MLGKRDTLELTDEEMKYWYIDQPSDELIKLFSYKAWRQRIHLEGLTYTPGACCQYEWDFCSMPDDLQGKSFLDVGANDGMFSFMAEERGALQVHAVDLYIENDHPDPDMTGGWPIRGIRHAKAVKKSAITITPCSIYELTKLNRQFDVVYCGNVIAWLYNPLEAIRQLASVTTETLIIREDISMIEGAPALEYVNNAEQTGCLFNGNEAFYRNCLTALGFKRIRFVPVDEYRILELRSNDFRKYEIPRGLKIYEHPFTEKVADVMEVSDMATGTTWVNGKVFLSNIGWINPEEARELPYSTIPRNPLKKCWFEKRYKMSMQQNYMIFAER